MKNLALNDLGVQELGSQEARETNGGGILFGAIVVVSAAIALYHLYRPYLPPIMRRRRRRR